MVGSLLISLLLAQITPGPSKPLGEGACTGEAGKSVRLAESRAEALNLKGASDAWSAAAATGCSEAEIPAHYLRGLMAAREAYAAGGSPESLEPVKQAIAALEKRGGNAPGLAEVAKYVLLAASSAAQSHRDEMALLLEHAIQLETIQLEAKQRLPGATAHEVAGDLYLQVHRFDEARQAYARAAARLGTTPRIRAGLEQIDAREKATAPRR